jgi:peptidoglycan hydrolase CwlO-like protein
MKRSSLETIVLVLGISIIGIALFMMYAMSSTPNSIFITNLVFSLGFLIYITYSMMSTNSLNKEIRGLNNHVKSLKDSILQKDQTIKDQKGEISNLNGEITQQKDQLSHAESTIQDLKNKITELESSLPDSEAKA